MALAEAHPEWMAGIGRLGIIRHRGLPTIMSTRLPNGRGAIRSPGTGIWFVVGFVSGTICLLILASLHALGASELDEDPPPGTSDVIFRDHFHDLDGWREWKFDKVDRLTLYEIREIEQQTVLRMEADSSASGLILDKNFSTVEGIIVRWRWRSDVPPGVSSPLRREGDDFAIRVYVIFERDASDAGWLERWALRKSPFRDEGILPGAQPCLRLD